MLPRPADVAADGAIRASPPEGELHARTERIFGPGSASSPLLARRDTAAVLPVFEKMSPEERGMLGLLVQKAKAPPRRRWQPCLH